MRKLEKRAILCLLMALVLALGMCLFVFRFVRDGDKWATFHANEHIYKNGYLSIGTIYDRNGMRLAANGLGPGGRPRYAGNAGIRRATAHAVGDVQGNVSTSAEAVFKKQIVGYNPLTGTYSVTGRGNDVKLSISAKACRTAYNALGNHNGLVGVYNYHTGEILCMVSKPTFDPASPPNPNTAASGTFMNKFLSGRMAPGSIFKQKVTVVGPRGEMKMSILGPTRKATQVEVSLTDARKLGIAAPVRESGCIEGTPGCKLVGPAGEYEISEGVIAAKRHIHFTPENAKECGVEDKQIVSVKIEGTERSLTFDEVVVRVSENYAPAMHIDTDESNAAMAFGEVYGEIIK